MHLRHQQNQQKSKISAIRYLIKHFSPNFVEIPSFDNNRENDSKNRAFSLVLAGSF
jgi:hypothetical protein